MLKTFPLFTGAAENLIGPMPWSRMKFICMGPPPSSQRLKSYKIRSQKSKNCPGPVICSTIDEGVEGHGFVSATTTNLQSKLSAKLCWPSSEWNGSHFHYCRGDYSATDLCLISGPLFRGWGVVKQMLRHPWWDGNSSFASSASQLLVL